jgi:hypothetical protein
VKGAKRTRKGAPNWDENENRLFCVSKQLVLNVKTDCFGSQNSLFLKALFQRLLSDPKKDLKVF